MKLSVRIRLVQPGTGPAPGFKFGHLETPRHESVVAWHCVRLSIMILVRMQQNACITNCWWACRGLALEAAAGPARPGGPAAKQRPRSGGL